MSDLLEKRIGSIRANAATGHLVVWSSNEKDEILLDINFPVIGKEFIDLYRPIVDAIREAEDLAQSYVIRKVAGHLESAATDLMLRSGAMQQEEES